MTASKRIFLVEDHSDTARSVKRYLEAYGYSVELASDVRSALRVGSETEFDLLICDLHLPDGTGWDVMEKLSARRPIRGIAFSAYNNTEHRRRSKKVGFADHIVKGYPDRLLRAVTRNTVGLS